MAMGFLRLVSWPATWAAALALAGCVAAPGAAPGFDAANQRHRPPSACRSRSSYQAVGLASWYGGRYHGRRTASGRIFNMHEYTAAHRTLPFGTVVVVTNLENRRSVRVEITDRGPFVDGRIVDLSRRAAEALGFVRQGVTRVRVRAC